MSELIIPKQHVSITSTTDVNDICKPLFNNSPICVFAWLRMYNDGNIQLLVNDTELEIHHVNTKNNPLAPWVSEELIKDKFFYFSLPSLNDRYDSALGDFRMLFNVYYPIYLFERYEDYFETFWFGSREDNINVINFYLNNMDMLENFKLYFKQKAALLIKKTAEKKLWVPEKMRSNILGKNNPPPSKSLDSLWNVKHYQVNLKDYHFTLSRREMEVILWIARGRTMKEVANILQLSQRTVEQYFNNTKTKSGLSKKSQIIDIVLECYPEETAILRR